MGSSGQGKNMDLILLEKQVLNKDWDALDIVDQATDQSQALPLLKGLLAHKDPEVRLIALNCINLIRDPQVAAILANALGDPDDDVRASAMQSLQGKYSEMILPALIENLCNPDPEIRGACAILIGRIGVASSLAALIERLELEDDDETRRDLMLASARLGDHDSKNFFASRLDIADSGTRYQAIQDLRYINDKYLASRLLPALDDTGDANLISPKSQTQAKHARVCDAAVTLIDLLWDHPFTFETSDLYVYSPEEIEQARKFLLTLK
jgi:HEAT repeats/HEAT repeat